MKVLFLFFALSSSLIFSQKKASKSMQFFGKEIEINANGLDNVEIENSDSNLVEIFLLDVNPNSHDIYSDEKNETLKLSFEDKITMNSDVVFRKFITKRLKRASVLIKIPKGKTIAFYGKTVGITSKNYQGNLNIYIDKGNIYLNTIFGNTEIKLFSGNIKATVHEHNIDIKSNNGKILIDKKEFKRQYKNGKNKQFDFSINSINANVVLTTKSE